MSVQDGAVKLFGLAAGVAVVGGFHGRGSLAGVHVPVEEILYIVRLLLL